MLDRDMVIPGKQCLTFTVMWLEHMQGTDGCCRGCAILDISSFLETLEPWAVLPWRRLVRIAAGSTAHHLASTRNLTATTQLR